MRSVNVGVGKRLFRGFTTPLALLSSVQGKVWWHRVQCANILDEKRQLPGTQSMRKIFQHFEYLSIPHFVDNSCDNSWMTLWTHLSLATSFAVKLKWSKRIFKRQQLHQKKSFLFLGAYVVQTCWRQKKLNGTWLDKRKYIREGIEWKGGNIKDQRYSGNCSEGEVTSRWKERTIQYKFWEMHTFFILPCFKEERIFLRY